MIKKVIKRICLFLVISITLGSILSGCGKPSNEQDPKQQSLEKPAKEKVLTLAYGDYLPKTNYLTQHI